MMRSVYSKVLAVCLLVLSTGAGAAEWVPTKPIRLLVPYAPGGTTDLIARIVAAPLGKELGQQIVVDNRGGGGGVIAMTAVARAQPDGYTIGMPALGAHASNETLLKVPYNSDKDFQPITFVGQSALVLVVSASNPAQSVERLLAPGRDGGKTITFASGGIGLAAHIAGELVKLQSKAAMTHVPYKGGGPAMADLMGGQVDMLFVPIGSALPLIQGGKLKALAVAGKARSPKLAGVATMEESGFPGFVMAETFAVLGPSGLRPEVVRRLHDTVASVIQQPEVVKRADAAGVELSSSTPQQLRDYIGGEVKKYRDVITRANIKVE